MIFDDQGHVWIHQSWMNDANACGERGRLLIVKPELAAAAGDAALCGTAVHLAIQHRLEGGTLGTAELTEMMYDRIITEVADPGIKWQKFENVDDLLANAVRCFDAWQSSIYPWLAENDMLGGRCEVTFQVPLYELDDGRKVGIEGTIDYLPPKNDTILDWKNPGRAYDPRKMQRLALQPTIYSLAAVLGGVDASDWNVTYDWPMQFIYGLAVRGPKKATPQLVRVIRYHRHAEFARERIMSWVDLALRYGLDRPWPRDDEHHLCSETWCPFWSECKGRHIGGRENDVPRQITLSTRPATQRRARRAA